MRRLIAAFAFVVLGLALASPRADAHALLAGSEPAAGALVDKAPSVVVLTFTERPDLSLSSIHVLDNSGKVVERGKPITVGGQRNTVAVAVPELARGTYTVTWRTTSADDGHTTAGSFAFGVGVQPSAPATTRSAPATPGPSVMSVVGRWTLYLGLALLLGAAVIGQRRRLLIPWLAAGLGIALLSIDVVRTSRVGVSRLVSTTTGNKLVFEIVAVLLCGVCAAVVTRRPGRRTASALALAVALALLARASAGHAAASSVPWFTVGTQWTHLLAVGVWVGGLPWLVVALRRAAPDDRAAIARRFSLIATVGLAAVIVTGSARAINEVGSWHGLFHTGFGVALLIKLALVAAMLVFAALNRFRHLAAAGTRLRVSVTAEAVVAAAVLGVTAVLAGLTPAASVAAATPRPTQVVVTAHDFGTTMKVRLTVSPGGVGPNHFVAKVTDFDTGKPVRATAVSLRFVPEGRADIPASTIALRHTGDTWVANSPVLAVNGGWQVTAVVQTDAGGTEIAMTLQTRQPPQRITAQRTPGLPTIYTIAIGSQRVQTYVDPGKVGSNDVHFTYLDVAGQPVDAELTKMTAQRNGAAPQALTSFRKLDTGHYVANTTLTRGRWTFTAVTADGLRTSFSETIA